MKRFVFGVLGVAIFFIGLGTLVERAGARFKSDDKALELVRKARVAIGGDAAIASVKSLRIVGQTARTFKVEGVDRTEAGETEIAMQLPNKLMKMVKIGHNDGTGSGDPEIRKQVEVVVVGDAKNAKTMTVTADGDAPNRAEVRRIVIKKADGTTEELNGAEAGKNVTVRRVEGGNAVFTVEDKDVSNPDNKQVIIRHAGGEGMAAHHEAMRQNEMLRLTLSLLMSSPEGLDVNYTYGGESDVDGTSCNVVVAESAGSSFKIYLSKSTDLPVMMSYQGMKMPTMMKFRTTSDAKAGDEPKDVVVFTRKAEGQAVAMTEFDVKFSDYRSVGGVQLPYKWTQTAAGNADETFDVTTYEINPANIADKFQNQNVMVRVKKPTDN
jgi:hypothetical protein